jgi:Xaa-Pro aminopeptidase
MQRIQALLEERELDALLITDLVNVRWLTGFPSTNALVVVTADGLVLMTDFRYVAGARRSARGAEVVQGKRDLVEDALALLPSGRIGFEDQVMTVASYGRWVAAGGEGRSFVGLGGAVEGLRAVKDPEELDRVRAAARLADEALSEVLTRGLAGRTERDVALDIEFTMRRLGAEAASFPPIVAAGAHGALPHAVPRDVEIPAGTLCVVDWGAQLDGYASDCTRTFATGEVDPRDREVYDLVLRAQETALAAVRPGPTGREVDAVARAIIDEAGHAEHFGHGLGHGVGLEVHEGPRLSKQGEDALGAGMVVTVEPGVYVPGAVGVRIEDLVIVTEDGAEVVSSLPKELRVVD